MWPPNLRVSGLCAAAFRLSFLICLSNALVYGYTGQHADDCPSLCHASGADPASWTQIQSPEDLESCPLPVMFDFIPQSSIDDFDGLRTIRACVFTANEIHNAEAEASSRSDDGLNAQYTSLTLARDCGAEVIQVSVEPEAASFEEKDTAISRDDVSAVVRQLSQFMGKASRCGNMTLFAKSGSAIAGMYSGAQVAKDGLSDLFEAFQDTSNGRGGGALQVCSPSSAALTFGVFVTSMSDLAAAQNAVREWTDARCLQLPGLLSAVRMATLVSKENRGNSTVSSSLLSGGPDNATSQPNAPELETRGNCKTQEVKSGDTCASLASRCHISGSDFTKYNPQKNLCSTLKPKQHVCCTAGKLPDFRPQPQSDGTCSVYKVASGDGCWAIADAHYLKQSDIEGFNKQTWGWAGCSHLQAGQVICLSKGKTPMPAAIPNAVCGPQVPGTKRPSDATSLASLNPCPLNACCDVWGFCGTTSEFCTKTPADTGAPGTAKPGTNGCISNCGTSIVNNGKAPASFMRVGYFESFSLDRSCLHMYAASIDTAAYTHIHFAFATVTSDFDVDVSAVAQQYAQFEAMKGSKKILAFGGWAFSTEQGTFQRFRDATKPANRGKFVDNLVKYIHSHRLDGLDFDWEYPGAPDIPDITPGSPDEGQHYLDFLILLKSKMSASKSISVALPASYWYLKQYPVSKMSSVVSYFIYMTYDLHGQWDVNNKWAIPGCEGGNCLRSHVNQTETQNSLAMLTKAGAPANKVVVGITSYGRSFRMTDSDCADPFCTFQGGPRSSQAYKGRCTDTAGYISNAEINEIIKDKSDKYSVKRTYVDRASSSNVLVYGNPGAVDWVAYMDGDVKKKRVNWIKGLNFAGTTDWAIDLQDFTGDDDDDQDGGGVHGDDGLGCTSDRDPGDLQHLADSVGTVQDFCLSMYALDRLRNMLKDTMAHFSSNSEGYDDLFKYYAQWVKDSINPQLVDYMRFGTGKGNKYFKCSWVYGQAKGSGPCTGMPHFWDSPTTSASVDYELADEQGFYDALATDLGIDKSWVKFGDHTASQACRSDNSDKPISPGAASRPCMDVYQTQHGVPVKVDDDQVDVGNPKALIEASMSNITSLADSLWGSYLAVGLGTYGDGDFSVSELDAIVAYSMPVFQLSTAVDSMNDIKEIGAKAKAEKRKQLILGILTLVFMIIPFVGEAIGPLVGSAASVARIATLIGEAGDAAVTVADIVADPASAPFAILGLITGVGGGTSKVSKFKALEEGASARRALKRADVEKFPKVFRDMDALVQKMTQRGCKI